MQLKRYWLIVRRWLWLAVLTVIVAASASWIVASKTTPTYEATTRLIVGPTLDSPSATYDTLRSSSQLVVTYRELVKTGAPLDTTIQTLNLPYTRAELGNHITVLGSDVTRLLTIHVNDSNPDRAAAIANTLSNALVQRSNQSTEPESQLTVVESAEPVYTPTAPNKPMLVVFGVTGALLLLGGLVLVVELLQNYVKTEDDLRELTNAQSLGTFLLGRPRAEVDPFLAPAGQTRPAPESFQMASLKLLASSQSTAPGATILVCAPAAHPATAEMAAYLAAASAQAGQATLVVDADPERRDLSRFFGCEREPGFADLVLDDARRDASGDQPVPLRDAVTVAGLHVLPAGALGSGDALPVEQLRRTLAALRELPAVSILAGPPLASSAEALVLAQQADAIVLVGVGDVTRSADVREAMANLNLVHGGQVWVALVTTSFMGRVMRAARMRRRGGAGATPSNLALEVERPVAAVAQGAGA